MGPPSSENYKEAIAALKDNVATRLDAIDKATVVLSETVTRVPTLLDREVARLIEMLRRSEDLMEVKFTGANTERILLRQAIENQFNERDVRSDQDKVAASKAIEAAFQSQKEAAAKSEVLFTKLIDSLQAIIANNTKTTDDKIALINARLAEGQGGEKAHAGSQATMIAIAAVIVSLVVGLFSILSNSHTNSAATVVSPAVVPVGPNR